jgi:1-acyl-sn-glycerol-3-phosphate acyltransferase
MLLRSQENMTHDSTGFNGAAGDALSCRFRPDRPAHQAVQRLLDVEPALEDGVDRGRDRHLDAVRRCQTSDRTGAEDTLDQGAGMATQGLRVGARADRVAKGHVARRQAGRGQDEVAQSGETHQGLSAAAKRLAEARQLGEAAAAGGTWLHDVLADVSQKKRGGITSETRLEELGFDSLMFTELAVALEAAGVTLPDPGELLGLETVADVEKLVARLGAKARSEKPRRDRERREKDAEEKRADDDIDVPGPLVSLGRQALRSGMRALYERVLETSVYGRPPPFGGYIVAANHASHLDTGLVKYALGEQGEALVALAAKDYFFEDPVRRMYFENFTNLVPMERHGSLRESLRLAGEVIRDGYILLIFPEGTRSETGVMTDFKPSLGYLAMTNRCGILPMYLAGTHEAMPKGRYLPKRGERVAAYLGPYLSYDEVVKLGGTGPRSEQYRNITYHVESVIRRLAPRDQAWTLGDAGTMPMAEYLASQGKTVENEEEEAR